MRHHAQDACGFDYYFNSIVKRSSYDVSSYFGIWAFDPQCRMSRVDAFEELNFVRYVSEKGFSLSCSSDTLVFYFGAAGFVDDFVSGLSGIVFKEIGGLLGADKIYIFVGNRGATSGVLEDVFYEGLGYDRLVEDLTLKCGSPAKNIRDIISGDRYFVFEIIG
jgi:hypothetical protein